MFQRARYLLMAFLVGAFLLAPVFVQRLDAQVLYGSVVGTVTDQSGALIPGATVTITSLQTGQVREGTTDAAGNYSILNVLEGTYDLNVSMTGFRNYVEKGVAVSINTVTRVNVSLQVGQVSDTVTVEASATVLQTSKADVSVNLDTHAMENLPLGNYRNYQSLINLVPGATPGEFQFADVTKEALQLLRPREGAALQDRFKRTPLFFPIRLVLSDLLLFPCICLSSLRVI